jgi:uncharacterized membrane protein YhhN
VAAVDWVAVARERTRIRPFSKPGCMLLLIAAGLVLDPADGGARAWLVAALVLSTLGDVFLLRDDATSFQLGLGSFLLAHVAYVVAFLLEGVHGAGLAVGAVAALAIVATLGRTVVGAARRGDEPALAPPVAVYVLVISTMVATAVGTHDPRAMGGAGLFAFSDALIAWDRFVARRSWAPVAIILTYHLAQALLVVSFTPGA